MQKSPAVWINPTCFYLAVILSPHLNLLNHLLAKGADLGGAGDCHVLRALVLAGHTVEGCGVVLHVIIQVRLETTEQRRQHEHQATENKHIFSPVTFLKLKFANSAPCWYCTIRGLQRTSRSMIMMLKLTWKCNVQPYFSVHEVKESSPILFLHPSVQSAVLIGH